MKRIFLLLSVLLMSVPCLADKTAGKPMSVQLTVYNQNFALVKEQRAMTLDKGINYVSVQDVAAFIQPNSVAVKSLTDPGAFVVREQNYQYDIIDPMTILNKSLGKDVTIRRYIDGTVREINGTVLNSMQLQNDPNSSGLGQASGLVLKTVNGIVMVPVSQIQEVQVPTLPEGLVPKPTLAWKLETTQPGVHNTEVSYLTNQMSWNADYVAVIDPLDKYVDLTGWVTLINNSGTTFENAALNLMAGDVHRVQPQGVRFKATYDALGVAGAPEPQFQEKSFFEYHLYTLKGKTTVRDKESKQIALMNAARIPAKKIYIYDGRQTWWNQYRYYQNYQPGESYDVSANKKVNVVLDIVNSAENNLGMPLPKGTIRAYKAEADSNQHFIGEDTIDHTPKDEKIRLYLGDAFDVVGEHKRINFRRISANEVEETFQITLRNHKAEPVTVIATEHLLGDWKITDSSAKYFKKDASTVEFPTNVAKDGEVKVTYTVRTKWQ